MSKKFLLLLVFLHLINLCFLKAQVDTVHYIPPFYYTGNTNNDFGDHYAILSTFESTPFTVTISNNAGFFQQITISQSSPQIIDLGNQFGAEGMIDVSKVNMALDDEGLVFSASKNFFVNITHYTNIQAMIVTSKGTVGFGKNFYSGHMNSVLEGNNHNNTRNRRRTHFISFMATENNTYVTVSNPNFMFDGQVSNTFTVALNKGQSYLIKRDFYNSGLNNTTINHVNGTNIASNKPIAVNSGSWTSGMDPGLRDIGVDQIVPVDIVGNQYIVIRGGGSNLCESVIVVATEPNTSVYLNGSSSAYGTITNAGDYLIIPESEYTSDDNMYIETDNAVYVYQSMAGSTSNATTGMYFIPRLTCNASKKVQISYADFLGNPDIKLITQAGSTISINGTTLSESPDAVTGNSYWDSYSLNGSILQNYNPGSNWNFTIESTGALNAALTIESGAIGAGGYYSGFGTVPEVVFEPVISGGGICGNNVKFSALGYNEYQWYKDGEILAGETDSVYITTEPGRYKVVGVTQCAGQPSSTYPSNEVTVLPCLSVDPSISITEGDAGNPNAVFTIRLSQSWDEDDVTFSYVTQGQTASGGNDFSTVSGTATISSGSSEVTIPVSILDDLFAEDSETFQLVISNATNAIISNDAGTCTINDDSDPQPQINLPASLTLNENAGDVDIPVTLSIESGQIITAIYSIGEGSAKDTLDYSSTYYSDTLLFAPGELTKNITLTIINDNIDEPGPNETLTITLSGIVNAQNGILNSNIDIVDDEPTPTLTLSSPSVSEGNSFIIDGTLSTPSSQTINFSSVTQDITAISPDDYSGYTITLTNILPDSTSFRINIAINDDIITEGLENFKISFSGLQYALFSNGSDTTTINASIIDNDGLPQVSVGNVSKEEGDTISFVVSISHPSATDITMDYLTQDITANTPADYNGIGTLTQLTIPASSLSQNVNITTNDDTDEEGNETFQIVLSNVSSNANLSSPTATATIIENDSTPVAVNNNYTLVEDGSYTGNILANDIKGDAPTIISAYGSPLHGSISLNTTTGAITYTPDANFNGKDSINYTIRDLDGDESTAWIRFTVTSVNDVPNAVNDNFSITENASLSNNVLSNDTGLGDSVTVSLVSNVSNGTLTLNADGTFSYVPDTQFYGNDAFTYRITDSNGDNSQANATINISFVNDYSPVAISDTFSTQEDTPIDYHLLSNDYDQDDVATGISTIDDESIFIVSPPSNGSISILPSSGGVIRYTPGTNFVGSDNFTYTVKDNSTSTSNQATVFITVTSTNDKPVAQCVANFTVYLDSLGSATLSATDVDNGSYDPEGQPITFSLSKSSFDESDLGSTTVTLTVRDDLNAIETCDVSVDVQDTILPWILTTQADTTIYAQTGQCGATVNYNTPVFQDNTSGTMSLTAGFASGSNFPIGTTEVRYQFTDISGNGPVETSFNISVVDTISPTITLPHTGIKTVQATASNNYPIVNDLLNAVISDNCSVGLTFSHNYGIGGSTLNGFTLSLGLHNIVWTAQDASGNTTVKTQQIEVESPISVTLTTSDTDSTICDGEIIEFTAIASGGTGNITYEFLVDGNLQYSGASSTWSSTVLNDGEEVSVRVIDESLNSSESDPIPVTVEPLPDTKDIYRNPNI